ncbi:MAG: tyrosine-type recombinase/integrase [Candidatus Binataceae bacterium]
MPSTQLKRLRARSAAGSVFRRDRSRYWQIKYKDEKGKWRYETTRATRKAEAQSLLNHRVYEASAGLLPGTATFEQMKQLVIDDAKTRGLRGWTRTQSALVALDAKFGGSRLTDIDYTAALNYAAKRLETRASGTVHLELAVLRYGLKLAKVAGLTTSVPDFPKLKPSGARSGFVEYEQWQAIRALLRSELQDVGDFAYLTGWRLMEILTLEWRQVDLVSRVIRLEPGTTKTGAARTLPFGTYHQLAEVIERRLAARDRLRAAGIIPRWVFCFDRDLAVAPGQRGKGRVFRHTGEPLLRADGQGPAGWVWDEWKRACEAAGLPGKLFHDFRRTAARNFDRAGMPRSVAKLIGGWKSDRMYSRYDIGSEAELAQALEGLSSWHSSGTNPKNVRIHRRK